MVATLSWPVPSRILLNILQIYQQHGHDEDAMVERFGLNREWLTDAGHLVQREKYDDIIDRLLEQDSIPGVGLTHGETARITDYGVLGALLMSSENLLMAAELADKYKHLSGCPLDFDSHVTHGYLSIRADREARKVRRYWAGEAILSGWRRVMSLCLGRPVPVARVRLEFPDPGYAKIYEEYFACPVEFDQPYTIMDIPLDVCREPFPSANSELFSIYIGLCEKAIKDLQFDTSMVDRIERLLLSSSGYMLNQENIAEYLAISPRTMQRKLRDEGTSYRTVQDRVRRQIAEEYLLNSSITVKEVSYLLGYSKLPGFYAACKRWFDCSPMEFRRRRLRSA